MPQTNDAPIRVTADTSGFDAAMADIVKSTENFGRVFASTMRQAVTSGRDLDDTLRSLALRFADLALDRALSSLDNTVGNLLGSLVSGLGQGGSGAGATGSSATKIVFNVNSRDASGFSKSQGQIAAMLARAVSRGQRST